MAVVADSQHLPAVVIALPAEIDMANAGRVAAELGSAFAPGVRTVIADMTATRFCDSSGISVLVRAHKQAVASRTELRLVAAAASGVRRPAVAGARSGARRGHGGRLPPSWATLASSDPGGYGPAGPPRRP